MAGVIPSQTAWEKVTQTVKTVLGEPGDEDGLKRPLIQTRAVVVQVTAARTGEIGRYDGKLYIQPNLHGAGGALGTGDLGTQKGDCIIWYGGDIGSTSATLPAGPYNGTLIGWDKEKAVVVVTGAPASGGGSPCTTSGSPTTIGGGTSETASTSTGTNGGGGTVINVVTRVVYNYAGDQKLYAFLRPLTFNACGNFTGYGAETRVIVDTPETGGCT